jgi:hypothetical protein
MEQQGFLESLFTVFVTEHPLCFKTVQMLEMKSAALQERGIHIVLAIKYQHTVII